MNHHSVSRETPFVGRAGDLAALQYALEVALGGQTTVVMLGGEAGVGKSRLVDEFLATDAAGRATAAVGHCFEVGELGSAFAPIAEVLRSLASQLGREELLSCVGSGRNAVLRLVPELQPADSHVRGGTGNPLGMVVTLFERLADQRPLIMVLEDVHWADASTQSLLSSLSRHVSSAPILVIATYRSDAVPRTHPLRPLLAELVRLRKVHRLELGRLSRDEVTQQLRGLLPGAPSAATAARIYETTGGNPFFVAELAAAETRASPRRVTDALRDVLLAPVERLSRQAQELLRTVAVCGDRVSYEFVAAVTDNDVDVLDAALRDVVDAGVLHTDGPDYVFRHALLREALYEDQLPGPRTRTHARCAIFLGANPELAQGPIPEQATAHHWHAAHYDHRAFTSYLQAAERAEDLRMPEEAHPVLEKALELWDHIADPVGVSGGDHSSVLMRAASAASDAGRFGRSLSLTNAALDELDIRTDLTRIGDMLYMKAELLRDLSAPDALTFLEEALALVPESPPSKARARLLALLAVRYLNADRFREALRIAGQALEVADPVGDDYAACRAYTAVGPCLVRLGFEADGLESLDLAVKHAADDPRGLAHCYSSISYSLSMIGRYRESANAAQAGMELVRALGITRHGRGIILRGNAAECAIVLGEWEHATQLLNDGLSVDPQSQSYTYLLKLQVHLTLWRGDVSGAARLMEQHDALQGGRGPVPKITVLTAWIAAEVALVEGDPERAWGIIEPALASAGSTDPQENLTFLAVAARVAGACARAGSEIPASDVNLFRERAGRLQEWPTAEFWTSLVDAELAGGVGDDVGAWQHAVAMADAAEGPVLMRAYARYRLGDALVVAGDGSGASAVLVEAADQADQLGATLLKRWIVDVQERPGLSDETGGDVDGYDLTARELDVLRLIVDGRTNKEIGADLYISHKTVSVHVSNILAKLGVSNRREAARLAERIGLSTGEI